MTSPTPRAAALLLALVGLLEGACGPSEITRPGSDPNAPDAPAVSSGPCAQTCDGCCYGEVCFTGNDVRGCGKSGQRCVECTGANTCTNGTCALPNDPCGGVTTAGRCATTTRVEVCVAPTGTGSPMLKTYDCPTGQTCRVANGVAGCASSGVCTDGATRCSSGALQTCAGGAWTPTACTGTCVESPLGASCSGGTTTGRLTGKLMYVAKGVTADRSDWGNTINAPAQGFLIQSVRIVNGVTTVLDTQTTTHTATDQGAFSLQIPQTLQPTDFIVALAAGTQADGSLSFLVADPQLDPGTHSVDDSIPSPAVWSWRWRTDSLTAGQTLTIGIDKGSGAARVFDYLRYVYALSDSRWPGAPSDPLIVWLGLGDEWSCGACNVSVPTYVFGTTFSDQIFLGGGADEGYWADAVTVHELGHWIMFMFGRPVGEGGRHCIGVPSAPGLAWSEGYATWFSSDARASSLYLDKQDGSMFWLDLASRGLQQDLYENEVSAMMWNLSATQLVGRAPFDAALASSRMVRPPFARGYSRHTWTVTPQCQRTDISDTRESTTFFADLLDALVCGGVAASKVDTATQPTVRYPYPSRSPLCQ